MVLERLLLPSEILLKNKTEPSLVIKMLSHTEKLKLKEGATYSSKWISYVFPSVMVSFSGCIEKGLYATAVAADESSKTQNNTQVLNFCSTVTDFF